MVMIAINEGMENYMRRLHFKHIVLDINEFKS